MVAIRIAVAMAHPIDRRSARRHSPLMARTADRVRTSAETVRSEPVYAALRDEDEGQSGGAIACPVEMSETP
jgi:hypothetical protein